MSDLVQRKCSTHPTLEQLSYSQFRQNTLDFIERVYTMPQPFLSMVRTLTEGSLPLGLSSLVRDVFRYSSSSHMFW